MKILIPKRTNKIEIYPSQTDPNEFELICWDIGGSPVERFYLIKEGE